jgi:predicted PurR-regulated permease PerM
MASGPRERLKQWLPHVLLLSLAGAAVWWLLQVIAPIREALLLGAALALLTHPVIYVPLENLFRRLLPSWNPDQRRYVASLMSTIALAAAGAGMLLLVLWAVIGDVPATLRAAAGLMFQDAKQIHVVIDVVAARTGALLQLYPSLGITPQDISLALEGFLVHNRFGPEFVKFLFTGTGGLIVQIVLTLTTVFYLYSQGPMLGRFLLTHLPLTERQQLGLRLRFHRTVQHMLAATIGKAVVLGLCLGGIAWAVAGFNVVLVSLVGVFAGLMPVVGHAFVWLPLAGVLASQGRWLEAGCLSAASIATAWLIEQATYRMATALGTDDEWLSFLLFLSVIGGALGSGLEGLIIGPAAVITVTVMVEFLGSLYGRDAEEAAEPEAAPKS